MGLYELTERLGKLEALDSAGHKVAEAVGRALPHGPVKDALSGTWLGHALHPVLTDVPIGTWASASILDILGGEDTGRSAELLIGVGLAAAVPTVAAGWSDWSDTQGSEQRIGLVHGASNGAVTLLYGSSLWARRRGNRGVGVSLGLLGAGLTLASAYLGGHLSLSKGVGVDQTAFEDGPSEWTTVMSEAALGPEPASADVGGTAVMLVRHRGAIKAIMDRCSHLSGPLHEGELRDDCIVCPWHGSVFRLDDGAVVEGPARAPQPAYDVRVEQGDIQVRLREPAHG